MYAVIFRATIKSLDDEYLRTAEYLRDKAFSDYGCVDFCVVSEGEAEGDQEVAISYWQSLDDIKRWKADAEHQAAREKSYGSWYSQVRVEVSEVMRDYQMSYS